VSESRAEQTQGQGAEQAQRPRPEDLVAELRKAKVADLLVQTCSLLASLGYAKLAPEARDLGQARLAIEALKALVPLLPEEPARDVRQAIAGLQLAFADAATSPKESPPAEPPSSESA